MKRLHVKDEPVIAEPELIKTDDLDISESGLRDAKNYLICMQNKAFELQNKINECRSKIKLIENGLRARRRK